MFSALNPLSAENFHRLFINGWIVDGRSGGLIAGRRHREGHIIMICPTDKLGEYTMAGLIEGGEYILCAEASEKHQDRLQKINGDKSACAQEVRPTTESRLINTRGEPHDKLLVVFNQFIVNVEATKRHFAELDAINARYLGHNGLLFTSEEVAELKRTVV